MLSIWDASAGVTPFWGVGISTGIKANSPVVTLSAWVLSSVEMGSDGGIEALVEAPYVAAVVEAEAIASATTSGPSKKPFIGALAIAGASLLMGW